MTDQEDQEDRDKLFKDAHLKYREDLRILRANVDKNPYKDIPELRFRGDTWHISDDYITMGSKRMVVHMFRLISKKNYEGITDMFTALSKGNQRNIRLYGQPKIKNDDFDDSTYQKLDYGYLGDAKSMSFFDKERIISLLKKEFNIVGNVTTPVEYAASLLESSTTQEDIINLWNIIFYLSDTENTKTNYMQDFLRKPVNLESFDHDTEVAMKNAIDKFKNVYFKKRMSERFGISNPFGKKPEAAAAPAAPVAEKKSMFSNPFAKKQEATAVPATTAAPAATEAAPAAPPVPATTEAAPAKTSMFSGFFGKKPAPAATPAAEAAAPVKKSFFSWGGRKTRKQGKSRKQNKSRKQSKSRKQGKSRKQRKTRK